MGMVRAFRRTIRALDLRICLLGVSLSCLVCSFVLWIGGGGAAYRRVCGECICPSSSLWLVCRQGVGMLLALSYAVYRGQCCRPRKGKWGDGWWLSGYLAMLLWLFLFLGGNFEVWSLLFLSWSILSFVFAIEWFARESLFAAVLLAVGVLWMIGGYGLALRIILWN